MRAPTCRFSAQRVNRALLLVILLATFPAVLAAQGLTPEQVVNLESVTSVAMSPDGEQVAFTLQKPRGENDAYGPSYVELWVIPAGGGNARPIVRGPNRVSQPIWSPDGATLSFAARLGRRSATQVYGIPARGGNPRVLTHSPNGVLSYAWSSTGEAIAYTEREPVPDEVAARRARGDDAIVAGENQRHVRLWIEMLDSEERRAITPADRTVWDFAWAPDGRRLAVQTTATPAIDDSYMFRELATVNAAGGGLERVVETPGKLGNMAWSPDGTKLAFVGAVSTNDPLAQSVFVVSAQGEAVNRTPNFGGSVTWLSWVDDQAVVFLANEGTKTTLNRVGSVQAAVQRVGGGGPEIISSVRFDANTRTFAAVASTSSHPNEVHVGSVSGGTVERITHHNARLEDVQLADQETIEWTHPDGTTIEGVLLHPVDEQPGVRYPLAILPHGGPEGISRDGWTTSALYPAQVLAARGYAVLMPNYRGTSLPVSIFWRGAVSSMWNASGAVALRTVATSRPGRGPATTTASRRPSRLRASRTGCRSRALLTSPTRCPLCTGISGGLTTPSWHGIDPPSRTSAKTTRRRWWLTDAGGSRCGRRAGASGAVTRVVSDARYSWCADGARGLSAGTPWAA